MSWDVAHAPLKAEILTRNFYEWELWGRGYFVHGETIRLEPPFCAFEGHILEEQAFLDDGVEQNVFSMFARGFFSLVLPRKETTLARKRAVEERVPEPAAKRELFEVTVTLPKDSEPSVELFSQALASLRYCSEPLAFEIVADEHEIAVQMASSESDRDVLGVQLKAHFPEALIACSKSPLAARWDMKGEGTAKVHEFGLDRDFFIPIASASELAADSLAALCGALDFLRPDEIAVYQVLFEPARSDWAASAKRALINRFGDPFFVDAPETVKQAEEKFSSSLYATVVRIGVKAADEARVWQIIKAVAGALELFTNANGNKLVLLSNDGYPDSDHQQDFLNRASRRYGMILSAQELVSLAHLPAPSVQSSRLVRRTKRTKAVASDCASSGIVFGLNDHDGRKTGVRLNTNQRLRHVHVVGNSGTGKSTLLLNLVCQDIYAGSGVAVLDPHGDLIDDILPYVPPERWRDVILFDASDDVYPVGFNILSAHSELEKTLLASDLVDVFRRLSTSWGDQMRSVLGNAILAFLESKTPGTLPELRRFLIEPAYRKEFLKQVADPEVVYYWEREFPLLKTQSLGPLLTRLDEFLRRKTIRYIVGQRENRLDFSKIMDEGKIFLARLPQGLIGQENSFMLGSLLISKFHQLAIARQEREQGDRRPFFLFLDEFHHFITPTLDTILSGGRKYGLGLTLAHQSVHQLAGADGVGRGVLSLAGTRICFRVGDDDAKKLEDGFSAFEFTDLQSLDNYEAICRVDRRENDFNLQTIRPPDLDDAVGWRRDYLRYLTRLAYGCPRQKVEEELAKARAAATEEPPVDPFLKRTAKNKTQTVDGSSYEKERQAPVPENPLPVERPPEPQLKIEAPVPVANEESASKADSRQHEAIKKRIMHEAEALDYKAEWEQPVLDGKGRVDVLLTRGTATIACEVSITTTIEHEVQNVSKCIQAGFGKVVVICMSTKRLRNIETAVNASIESLEVSRVHYCLPSEFVTKLYEWTMADSKQSPNSQPRKQKIRLFGEEMPNDERRKIEEEMLAELSRRLKPK